MDIQDVYNAYLGTSRRAQGQPWKPRKKFDGFENTPDGFICKRLELFFNKFPQIRPQEFFYAPYEMYEDETYFPLNFYTTQKAIAVYSAFLKKRQEEDPDTSNQIQDIKKSLKYIAQECVKRDISFLQYCNLKEGYTFLPFVDYANKNINIYVLIKLPFFDTQLNSINNLHDKELYLKDTFNNIGKYKMRLNESVTAKHLINEGIKILTNKLTN
jgi:hypothetical protein